MSVDDEYRKAIDALGDAIREVRGLLSKRDPTTYGLAIKKRALEKDLREAGYTKTEAGAAVSRAFEIDKLGDNTQ